MKKLIVFFVLLVSSLCYSQTLPFEGFDGVFYNPSTLTHHEGQDFDVAHNGGSEYLEYHGILPVFRNENPYLFYPKTVLGIMDVGIFSEHEDFHKFYEGILGGGQSNIPEFSHGTLVSSISGFSMINNQVGIHGIVNSKVAFMDNGSFNDYNYFSNFISKSNAKIINISILIDFCVTRKAYTLAQDTGSVIECPHLDENSVYTSAVTQQHIENIQAIRELIQEYPNILFVFAAGNSGVDAKLENGAIHYAIDANGNPYLDKLPNVLVVGSIDNQGILTEYSNYGESLDVVAIGNAYGATEVVSSITGSNSGIVFNESHLYETESGTSFSAPITSGLSMILDTVDQNLLPQEIKELLVQETDQTAHLRYLKGQYSNGVQMVTSAIPVPVLKFQSSYTVLKNRLQIETYQDISALNGVDITASNDVQCINVWNAGESPRTVVGSGKSYEAKFYGDRCLYFRGNSYIIDFDFATKTATRHTFEGYGQNKFREYMTFRNLTNNLQSANTNTTWRDGYEVALNGSEKVGCTTADNCVDGNITTVEHCTNLFKAITGDFPSVMGVKKVDAGCSFYNNETGRIISYNQYDGGIYVDKIQPWRVFEDYKNELQSKVDYLHQIWLSQGKRSSIIVDGEKVRYSSSGYPKTIHNLETGKSVFSRFFVLVNEMEMIRPLGIYSNCYVYHDYVSNLYLKYNFDTGLVFESSTL